MSENNDEKVSTSSRESEAATEIPLKDLSKLKTDNDDDHESIKQDADNSADAEQSKKDTFKPIS